MCGEDQNNLLMYRTLLQTHVASGVGVCPVLATMPGRAGSLRQGCVNSCFNF